ncbi:sulfite exporter TauE/SafE family protein [Limosilactobacillus sp.]|uniref:sulfite exporter TauE/SafE family protein n=1 Tax=Limosilactobacillus sp. TaxID=2773925 RepID=UPI0025C70772|nr:sulfite exporter TauE/SafE family protein [Limosilactobacillus sp.]MCH3922521.1 sulfite exporter TauE/SafE family protein [Limosilactobacillus sp.]MCH3927203.1 sulfite exporter TauE/SafE family protein [Limosilactobacillus sp.]
MLQLLSLILIGFLVGIFVISLGGGGGAIYLGVLTGIFRLAPAAAAATSIVTALPALVIGAWSYYRKGLIDFKLGSRMMLAAIPSIFVGFFISPLIPQQIYKVVIGLILVALGLQIIYQLYHNRPSKHRHLSPRLASVLYGILGGLMVGIAGLSGGGPITAGLLILGVPMKNASATSSYVLVGMSIVGALLHLTGGNVDWQAAGGLIAGSLAGAVLAPTVIIWLTNKPSRAFLVKLFMGIFVATMGIVSMR